MKWWNQKVVIQEESVQEENVEQNESVGDDTKSTMAMPHLPFEPALLATTS
jgi:hypothetical protein